MFQANMRLNSDSDFESGEFIQEFPRWYTFAKWGVPLTAALLTGLCVGLVITNTVVLPGFLASMQWLPGFYQGLESFGAFAFLSLSVTSSSLIIGFSTLLMARLALFPFLEELADRNIQAHRLVAKIEHKHFKLKQKELEEKLNDTSLALLQATEENSKLNHSNAQCTPQFDAVSGSPNNRTEPQHPVAMSANDNDQSLDSANNDAEDSHDSHSKLAVN